MFEGEGNSQSSLLTLTIEDNVSVFEGRSYTDLNCTVPAVSAVTGDELVDRVEDTLIFPGDTVATSLGEAPFIDFFLTARPRAIAFSLLLRHQMNDCILVAASVTPRKIVHFPWISFFLCKDVVLFFE